MTHLRDHSRYKLRQSDHERALEAQCADLEAQLASALELLHEKNDHEMIEGRLRKSIGDLKNRLKLSTEANHALRIDNARLLALAQRGAL